MRHTSDPPIAAEESGIDHRRKNSRLTGLKTSGRIRRMVVAIKSVRNQGELAMGHRADVAAALRRTEITASEHWRRCHL